MSFREKVAWASLFAHIVVFGWYFTDFAQNWTARIVSSDHGLGQMVGAIIALVLLSIAIAIAAIVSTPKDDIRPQYDERERLIRLRAANITAAVVTVGVILVMNVLMLGWNPVLAANLLLAALVTGEIVKALAQIIQFRAT
jgi:Ca2+/Na+ antiporter